MDKKLITIEKLSELSGVAVKILSEYVKKGLLYFRYEDENGNRFYNEEKSLKNLEEIKRLKKEGHADKEIKERLQLSYGLDFIEDLKE